MIRREDLARLLLPLAILLGLWIRLTPTLLAGFPVNDGGMFMSMMDDLAANSYALPEFASFNHIHLPYAYPPLGFYLSRLLADLAGLTSLEAARWVPALVSALSVPAFYLLARQLTPTRYHAALATLLFALLPRAFSWMVLGGGVTRAWGQLFTLLMLWALMRLYRRPSGPQAALTGLFGGLAVLSHPEWAVHAVVGGALLWAFHGRTRAKFIASLQVAGVALLVISPWLVAILARHGLGPILNAVATSQKWLAVAHLAFFYFTEEPYLTILATLGLLGLARSLSQRSYFLPVWLAAPFLIEGRSAMLPAAIPLALLGSIALVDVIFPRLKPDARTESDSPGAVSRFEQIAIGYLLFYLIFSAYQYTQTLATVSLTPPQRLAMQWVRENTPAESRFLVLTGSASIVCDPLPEWFPALSGRASLLTVQGSEWTLGADIQPLINRALAAQACLAADLNCLATHTAGLEYDYLYLNKTLRQDNCEPIRIHTSFAHFFAQVQASKQFEPVYENEETLIYKKR